jgi:hypothetical protein
MNDWEGNGEMKEETKTDTGQAAKKKRPSEGREGAMSPSMRELILSFVTADSEQVWDPDAYARRPQHAG